ncbi:MAG: hydantoinase B/oxoprolinase family protein [Actinobacteria bacterium]|nr:MAG: hydantoinase B/oxoprolinase family protein [Actinomycetota bacterium]
MTIELQIIGSLLRAVAEEMGAVLVRSAFSANIKERRDCSTALFDERGRMVAQAEHIPVHLGAMPDAVAAVMQHGPAFGEVWALNDPYAGGTHLPDITLVSRTETGFAVTRAHHADVGGSEPGSMPADSRTLDDEGVVIPPTRLDDDMITSLVTRMRNPEERRGDLRAQLAAHRLAEQRVAELCERRGRDTVVAAMDEVFDYSERRMRAGIAALPDGRFEGRDVLEAIDGELELHVTVTVEGDAVAIDFTGTAPQHDGNLNCPLSVARSACFYVVRVLVDPDLPASGGAFAPVTVTAPEGCLVNARPPAAVAAGNVETSSRIVDVVMRAFGEAIDVPAQGQGTMNNVTLGNERFTYYETIGGGQGACPDADGPSGVHVAMSNTLSTPIEAVELQYPLRVERYALRLGSGGAGRYRGGDGVLRELRVLEDCRLSIISERRSHVPQGERGGEAGAPGRNSLNGDPLPAKVTRDLAAGDVVTIETPGGGGWGR